MLNIFRSYTFQKFAFEPKSKKPPASASSARGSSTGKSKDAPPVRTKAIDVVQIVMKEDEEKFDEKQKSVLNELQRVCKSAADIRMAGKLFNDYDVNGNSKLIPSISIPLDVWLFDELRFFGNR